MEEADALDASVREHRGVTAFEFEVPNGCPVTA